MEFGGGGLKPPVIDIERYSIMPPTIVVDPISVANGMVAEETGTQFEGLHADIDELVP